MKKNRSINWAIIVLLCVPLALFGQDDIVYVGQISVPEPIAFEKMGTAIDTYENYVVTTAPDSKRAYLFKRNSDESFSLVHTFQGPDEAEGYGNSVAIYGDYVAVGAPLQDDGNADVGKVYFYDGTNNWEETIIFDDFGENENDRFGYAIDMYENKLVISEPQVEFSPEGRVHYFKRQNNIWAMITIVDPNLIGAASYGLSIDFDGQRMIVGAPDYLNMNECPTSGGTAFIYDFNADNDSWTLLDQVCNDSQNNVEGQFASAVAIEGDRVAIGGRQYEADGLLNRGIVAIYEWNAGEVNFNLIKELNNDIAVEKEFNGTSVSLSGDVVVSGAPGNYLNESTLTGRALFNLKDHDGQLDSWGLIYETNIENAEANDKIGRAVASSGDYHYVGASNRDLELFKGAGAIFVYKNCYIPTSFIAQPESQDVCLNATAIFSVDIEDLDYTYQWYKNDVMLEEQPGKFEGVKSKTLNILETSSEDIGEYHCVVSAACGSPLVSETATLGVNDITQIITPLTDIEVCQDNSVEFQVDITGDNVTYQWYKDGQALAGKTNSNLFVLDVNVDDEGTYACVATGTCGTVEDDVKLTITDGLSISQENQDLVYCAGDQATLELNTNIEGLTYQWYKDAVIIADATNKNYELSSLTVDDAGTYTIQVTGSCGDPIMVGIAAIDIQDSPQITGISDHVDVRVGEDIELSITTEGEVLSYLWQKDGQPLSEEDGFEGITSATLSFTDAQEGNSGEYSCKVTGVCDSTYVSEPIIVTITEEGPGNPVTGIEVSHNTLSFYPNPSTGQIYLKGLQPTAGKLLVYDTKGLLVDIYLLDDAKELYTVDMRSLTPGLYYLKLYQDKVLKTSVISIQ